VATGSERAETPAGALSGGSGETILVTGATGFLGQRIIGVLLEKYPAARLAIMLRKKRELSVEERLHGIVKQAVAPERRESALSRIEVFPTEDISDERCGLAPENYRTVAGRVTRIIHAAATVRFDHPLDYARRINVGGTRNVLELAEEAAGRGVLRSFTYIGTAFVAGERKGLVRENELAAGQTFRNTYEMTKFEAEKLVRSRMGVVPTVIARPSIIVGDSRTGATTSFKTLYWPLKILVKHNWRIIPASPDGIVDLVPVDFVAEAVVALSFTPEAVGSCFHLCAGPERCLTVGDVVTAATTFFSLKSSFYIPPGPFFAVVRPLLYATLWGKKRRMLRDAAMYRPYFRVRTLFDTACSENMLAPAGIRMPELSRFLDRLFHFCRETDWGARHPANGV